MQPLIGTRPHQAVAGNHESETVRASDLFNFMATAPTPIVTTRDNSSIDMVIHDWCIATLFAVLTLSETRTPVRPAQRAAD